MSKLFFLEFPNIVLLVTIGGETNSGWHLNPLLQRSPWIQWMYVLYIRLEHISGHSIPSLFQPQLKLLILALSVRIPLLYCLLLLFIWGWLFTLPLNLHLLLAQPIRSACLAVIYPQRGGLLIIGLGLGLILRILQRGWLTNRTVDWVIWGALFSDTSLLLAFLDTILVIVIDAVTVLALKYDQSLILWKQIEVAHEISAT